MTDASGVPRVVLVTGDGCRNLTDFSKAFELD
jgi:hypothetical protein